MSRSRSDLPRARMPVPGIKNADTRLTIRSVDAFDADA